MAIGYVVKHNRLPLKSLLFSRSDAVLAEESVEVGAVDVDFATYLREGDEALVAVILPRLGEMPRSLRAVSDSIHSLLESSALRRVMRSMICSSVAWRLRHSSSGTTNSNVDGVIFCGVLCIRA